MSQIALALFFALLGVIRKLNDALWERGEVSRLVFLTWDVGKCLGIRGSKRPVLPGIICC